MITSMLKPVWSEPLVLLDPVFYFIYLFILRNCIPHLPRQTSSLVSLPTRVFLPAISFRFIYSKELMAFVNPQNRTESSPSSRGWKYDVFLSFRGQDTRNKFTGHLYRALVQESIHTFMDSKELPRGEEIEENF